MYTRIFSLLMCCGLLAVTFAACSSASTPTSAKGATPTPRVRPIIHTKPLSEDERPVQVLIPAIQVSASVEPVGVRSNGDLDTPQKQPWDDTGWYTSSPFPGTQGSTIIDGHLDRPGGAPAVFWNLHLLQVGAQITVITASHTTLNFQVTRVAFYAPGAAPLQAIFGDGSGRYLNLITCAGDWDESTRQTTQRLVVYATLSV